MCHAPRRCNFVKSLFYSSLQACWLFSAHTWDQHWISHIILVTSCVSHYIISVISLHVLLWVLVYRDHSIIRYLGAHVTTRPYSQLTSHCAIATLTNRKMRFMKWRLGQASKKYQVFTESPGVCKVVGFKNIPSTPQQDQTSDMRVPPIPETMVPSVPHESVSPVSSKSRYGV